MTWTGEAPVQKGTRHHLYPPNFWNGDVEKTKKRARQDGDSSRPPLEIKESPSLVGERYRNADESRLHRDSSRPPTFASSTSHKSSAGCCRQKKWSSAGGLPAGGKNGGAPAGAPEHTKRHRSTRKSALSFSCARRPQGKKDFCPVTRHLMSCLRREDPV